MKTILPEKITNIEEAKAHLKALYDNGEAYHPEDDAHDIVNLSERLFTDTEADALNILMDQIYALHWGSDFDPCGYILSLDPDYKMEE